MTRDFNEIERFSAWYASWMWLKAVTTYLDIAMYDLNSLPLNTLVHVATRSNLIDECRTTDWVVVLRVDGDELVMNHANAHVFLQGMIRGSFRRETLLKRVGNLPFEEVPSARSKEDRRVLIG